MKGRGRLLTVICGAIPALAAALLSLYRPSFLRDLEYATYDTLVRAAPVRPPDPRVVIVDIDERSLSAVGQWPWRRDVIASLISALRDRGAATVALDIMFAESDRYEGTNTDAILAETLRAGKVVLGYGLTFEPSSARASACVQHPFGLAIVRRDDNQDDPFFRATGAVCNLVPLTRAAGASGFLNAAPDPDGLLRRVPLMAELDGQVYPALSLAAVSAATTRRHDAVLAVANVNTSALVLENRRVPLDGKSNLLVRYRGRKHTFPYVSAADVLSGAASSETFRDKIVFVGTTALGTREVVATPLDTLFAGVEVQATVADNLLQQDFLRRPEHAVTIETQAVFALAFMATLVVSQFGLPWGAVSGAACITLAWTASYWLFVSAGTFLSPLYPTIGLLGSLTAMTGARFAAEHRRADRAMSDRAMSQKLMVQSLLSLTEVRDAETGRHSRRTQRYARVLAEQLATNPQYRAYLTAEHIDLLASLAPLHDIGKVGVPDRLLNKPGDLTPEELVEMRKHPAHGRDVILHAEREVGVHDDRILAMAKDIVYTHHEKWDGSGYPEGLRGTEIPIAGRLMALVDVYDAVRTRSLYKPTMTHADAVKLIVSGRGTHFDPAVVDAFVKVSDVMEQIASDQY